MNPTHSIFSAAVTLGQSFTDGTNAYTVSEVMPDRTFAYVLRNGMPYQWREIIRRRDGFEAIEGLTPC